MAKVDKDQIEKVTFFLRHQLLKAHLQGVALKAFIYNEKGELKIEVEDGKTEAAKYNVPAPAADEDDTDPLS